MLHHATLLLPVTPTSTGTGNENGDCTPEVIISHVIKYR